MSRVILEGTAKYYGEVVGLHATDLEIRDGEFLTLLGPSGCGKTTTLRLIAGFLHPSAGRIIVDGEDITHVPPQKRNIGMVFQNYALFPHMTIKDNIGFALQERKRPKSEIELRTRELLELIRLPGIENRHPANLSGGQQQRIALARAVAFPPRILLMDEPLGALDLKLREAMQTELRRIHQKLGITTIYVTHDQNEAMSLSDRIAVMNEGRIIQIGSGKEIYDRPRTKFVADFIGRINLLSVGGIERQGENVKIDIGGERVLVSNLPPTVNNQLALAIRPERIRILPDGADPGEWNVLEGVIVNRVFIGNLLTVEVRLISGGTVKVEMRPDDFNGSPGEKVRLTWDMHNCVLVSE